MVFERMAVIIANEFRRVDAQDVAFDVPREGRVETPVQSRMATVDRVVIECRAVRLNVRKLCQEVCKRRREPVTATGSYLCRFD